jgi:hypothetical protein
MSFKKLLKDIEGSAIFKEFKINHPKAELCAGFFVLDFLGPESKQTLDYKEGEDVYTFTLDRNHEVLIAKDKFLEVPNKPILQKISKKIKLELEDLKSTVEIKLLNENIKSSLQKIIAVLQKYDNNGTNVQAWSLTCILEAMQILHIIIDADTAKIIKFEKKSLMDFIKKRP